MIFPVLLFKTKYRVFLFSKLDGNVKLLKSVKFTPYGNIVI